MLFPHLGLFLVFADEAQELHQGAFGLEVELVILEDILSAVWNFQQPPMR
jgi:hypothetical protein